MLTTGGGGGSSLMVVASAAFSLIQGGIQGWIVLMNGMLSIVSSVNTLSVSFFKGSVFAFGPAAQATMLEN